MNNGSGSHHSLNKGRSVIILESSLRKQSSQSEKLNLHKFKDYKLPHIDKDQRGSLFIVDMSLWRDAYALRREVGS